MTLPAGTAGGRMLHAYVYLHDQGCLWKGRQGYRTPASFGLTSLACKWKIFGIKRKRRENRIRERNVQGCGQREKVEKAELNLSRSPLKGHLETELCLEKTQTSDRADLGVSEN